MTNTNRRQQAIDLAEELYRMIDLHELDRLLSERIDSALAKLSNLSILYGRENREIEAAKCCLQRMKSGSSDRYSLALSLKHTTYCIRISAYKL
jgi:hypothetical protein